MSQRLDWATPVRRLVRNLWVAACGAGLALAVGWGLKPLSNVYRELARFEDTQKEVLGSFNALVEQAGTDKMSDGDFADRVERDVLPKWQEQRSRLQEIESLSARSSRLVAQLVEYMKLREDAWMLLVEALRGHDLEKARQSKEKSVAAEKLARQLGSRSGD